MYRRQPLALSTRTPTNAPGRSLTGRTPSSTTSLSSPFSQSPLHPHATTPYGSARLFNGIILTEGPASEYNPQHWSPGETLLNTGIMDVSMQNDRMNHGAGRVIRSRESEQPLASPPPPYSASGIPASLERNHSQASFGTDIHHLHRNYNSTNHDSSNPTDAFALDGARSQSQNRHSPPLRPAQTASINVSPTTVFPPPPPGSHCEPTRVSSNRFFAARTPRESTTIEGPYFARPSVSTLESRYEGFVPEMFHERVLVRAPASRRAVSTGTIGLASGYSETSTISAANTLDTDLAIPPPPPGPPPRGTRSQSLCRPIEALAMNHTMPIASQSRWHQQNRTTLETVPPTPAGWKDEALSNLLIENRLSFEDTESSFAPACDISTVSPAQGQSNSVTARYRRDSSTGPLYRSIAVRNRSSKGIRERRSESRNGPQAAQVIGHSTRMTSTLPEASESNKPSDLTFPTTSFSNARRRTSARSSPQLTQRSEVDLNKSGGSLDLTAGPSIVAPSKISCRTPARTTLSSYNPSPQMDVYPTISNSDSQPLPITPIPSSAGTNPQSAIDTPIEFAKCATQRHRNFIEREAATQDDTERIRLFLDHVLEETRYRKDWYQCSFGKNLVEIETLVLGILKATDSSRSEHQSPMEDYNIQRLQRLQRVVYASEAKSQTGPTVTPAAAKLTLTINTHKTDNGENRNEYLPCLSPIASMSVVTGRDEMDSRGRAPSRWWESESRDSSRGNRFKVLERSKRESKYMGISPDVTLAVDHCSSPLGLPSKFLAQTGKELDDTVSTPDPFCFQIQRTSPLDAVMPTGSSQLQNMARPSPSPNKFDISRLITLPPPFPRHYPALNNNHPHLSHVRAALRSLSDPEHAKALRRSYKEQVSQYSPSCGHPPAMGHRPQQNSMSYSDTDDERLVHDIHWEKKVLNQKFDIFQSALVGPLHSHLVDQISQATQQFDHIQSQLLSDAQSNSPNLPQEEGDGHPELVEKLTLFKWIFEARENFHRELHQLLDERNEQYRNLVMFPYQQASDLEKIEDVTTFFTKDKSARTEALRSAACSRHKSFLQTIEFHVNRGVETQISAFWDIAPGLLGLLQEIPTHELHNFEILIPQKELVENAVYQKHPLKYLYSVVSHAEASSRQFIESQISLWCLLQEVREGLMGVKMKVELSGFEDERFKELERLASIEDLKEKVATVEGQWIEGLGGAFAKAKVNIKESLVNRGVWDEADEN